MWNVFALWRRRVKFCVNWPQGGANFKNQKISSPFSSSSSWCLFFACPFYVWSRIKLASCTWPLNCRPRIDFSLEIYSAQDLPLDNSKDIMNWSENPSLIWQSSKQRIHINRRCTVTNTNNGYWPNSSLNYSY